MSSFRDVNVDLNPIRENALLWNMIWMSPLLSQLFGEVCFHCNRAIEGDGETLFI